MRTRAVAASMLEHPQAILLPADTPLQRALEIVVQSLLGRPPLRLQARSGDDLRRRRHAQRYPRGHLHRPDHLPAGQADDIRRRECERFAVQQPPAQVSHQQFAREQRHDGAWPAGIREPQIPDVVGGGRRRHHAVHRPAIDDRVEQPPRLRELQPYELLRRHQFEAGEPPPPATLVHGQADVGKFHAASPIGDRLGGLCSGWHVVLGRRRWRGRRLENIAGRRFAGDEFELSHAGNAAYCPVFRRRLERRLQAVFGAIFNERA